VTFQNSNLGISQHSFLSVIGLSLYSSLSVHFLFYLYTYFFCSIFSRNNYAYTYYIRKNVKSEVFYSNHIKSPIKGGRFFGTFLSLSSTPVGSPMSNSYRKSYITHYDFPVNSHIVFSHNI